MALLARKAPALSPARAALAAAIEAHTAYVRDRDNATAAVSRATEAVLAGERAVREAEEGVRAVEQAMVQTFMSGNAGQAPGAIREARNALADAQDNLAAARQARDAVEAEARRLETTFTDATVGYRVRDALRADDAVAALVRKVDQLQRELIEHGTALVYLNNIDALPHADDGTGTERTARMAVSRFTTPPTTWAQIHNTATDGSAPWRVAVATLQADPTAPLPEIR